MRHPGGQNHNARSIAVVDKVQRSPHLPEAGFHVEEAPRPKEYCELAKDYAVQQLFCRSNIANEFMDRCRQPAERDVRYNAALRPE